ncbi:MAG TPA: hypothetical protein DD811_10150, partial [Syntrophomonas sp.]|nr:hypothetical protein [Syntrophomonas sp.]
GLLAVGQTGTELVEFDLHQFMTLTAESEPNESAGLLKRWTQQWNSIGSKTDLQIDGDTALNIQQLEDFNTNV